MQKKKNPRFLLAGILAAVLVLSLSACTIDIHTKSGENIHIDLDEVDWEALGLEDPEKNWSTGEELPQIQLNDTTMALLKIFMEANGYGAYYQVIEDAYEKDPDVIQQVFDTGAVDGLVRLFIKESAGGEHTDAETPITAFQGDFGG